MNVLVIEDDNRIASLVDRALTEDGHNVAVSDNGCEGAERLLSGKFDAALLDILLPEMDGFEVLRRVRTRHCKTPILVLTAVDAVPKIVEAFDLGADDYLVKPFAFGELLARLDALLRRTQAGTAETTLVVGNLVMDLLSRKVTRGEKNVTLQPREFKLLEYLMRHANQVVTRTMLLENVWDYHFDPQTNVVDVHVSKLRQKIDAGSARPLLRTIRNAGYMLTADE